MGNKIFLAGIVIVVVLILIPAFNEIFTTLINDMLVAHFGDNAFQLAFWHMVPLAVFAYLLAAVPIQIIASIRKGRDVNREE